MFLVSLTTTLQCIGSATEIQHVFKIWNILLLEFSFQSVRSSVLPHFWHALHIHWPNMTKNCQKWQITKIGPKWPKLVKNRRNCQQQKKWNWQKQPNLAKNCRNWQKFPELAKIDKFFCVGHTPERPKGAKYKVKRPKGPPARSRGPEGP